MAIQACVIGSGKLSLGLLVPALITAPIDTQLLTGYRTDARDETRLVEAKIREQGEYFIFHAPGKGRTERKTFRIPCDAITLDEFTISPDVFRILGRQAGDDD